MINETDYGLPLVAQWLRIYLPMLGFNPWSRKIPHTMKQLSQPGTTTKPMCCKYRSSCAYSLYSTTREATAMRSLFTATE